MKTGHYGDTRRSFLRSLGRLGAAATASLPGMSASMRDSFGGLRDASFEPSGYFRVERKDRWWFVTPEGSGFLSFGLNHPNKDYLRQTYNIAHWKGRFGVDDAYGASFLRAFAAKAMKDIETFGMNTLGCHALKEDFGTITIPYIQGLFFARTAYWLVRSPADFPDVFSDGFAQRCDRVAQRVAAPRRRDPYLMGYTFTNVPILTDADADAHGEVPWGRAQPAMPTWPRVLRNLGPGAPGKIAFLDLARRRYPSIEGFNRVYRTGFASFEGLAEASEWSPWVRSAEIDDLEDNQAFLLEILERYYTVACRAVRRFDPEHLIFGDPLNANAPPPDAVVTEIARHVDLIAYQFYAGYEEQAPLLDRWSSLTGKPLFHADSSFSVADEHMPAPIGVVCPDHPTRARRFLDCATRSFSRPDLIGWNWCGWMDMWSGWKNDRQHTGLQDPFGRYHHPMPETMARFGRQLYTVGRRATGGPRP